jgi:hypothetical protein
LQRLHPIDRQLEMLLEKSLENFHEKNVTDLVITSLKITLCAQRSRKPNGVGLPMVMRALLSKFMIVSCKVASIAPRNE